MNDEKAFELLGDVMATIKRVIVYDPDMDRLAGKLLDATPATYDDRRRDWWQDQRLREYGRDPVRG